MGMGGNIGTQSSTIVVRGISTGFLDVREIWAVVFKEHINGVESGGAFDADFRDFTRGYFHFVTLMAYTSTGICPKCTHNRLLQLSGLL